MGSRFSEQADLYAKYRPHYPPELYNIIFNHIQTTERAWDCATGSGQVAQQLAKNFNHVTATDISREQLVHASDAENISYSIAPAENSGLPANHFDLITVAQAIHWFNFDEFYEEVCRVGKAGGLLAVIGYSMISIGDRVDPILEALYEEAFGTYFNENRQYLDQYYRTIPFPFEEIQTPNLEYTVSWSIDQLQGYFNSWSAIQKMKSDQGYNPVPKTMSKLKSKLPGNQKLEVSFPIFMRLGRIVPD